MPEAQPFYRRGQLLSLPTHIFRFVGLCSKHFQWSSVGLGSAMAGLLLSTHAARADTDIRSTHPSSAAETRLESASSQKSNSELQMLTGIYDGRDSNWNVSIVLNNAVLKIGRDTLDFSINSNHDGFAYVFYSGSRPGSLYLLFPNQLDTNNIIAANKQLQLPRTSWTVNALGPVGVDHLLAVITASPRDFSDYSLTSEYVSTEGPFKKIATSSRGLARIQSILTLSDVLNRSNCESGKTDSRGLSRTCSNAYGADLRSVIEEN